LFASTAVEATVESKQPWLPLSLSFLAYQLWAFVVVFPQRSEGRPRRCEAKPSLSLSAGPKEGRIDKKNGADPGWRLRRFYAVRSNELAEAKLFLLAIAVTRKELINTTCGVNEFLLAGEEGVGRRCDFKLYQRIGFAIDFNSLLSSHGRMGDEDFIVRHIFENYFAIVGRMDVFFHFIC
jgi:hypothetical protein